MLAASYDIGLETLQADSFVVTGRHPIYTHPATGAETRLLTITERRRNRPMTLDQALDYLADARAVLLVNERSGRAAVQIPAPSFMLDDGEIESRVRLIRPMEHHHASMKMMDESHWQPTDRETFAAAWNGEVVDVPEFAESTLHIVAGLLLRSGSGCRTSRRASIGSRPMLASASSVAGSRQLGPRALA